MLYDNIQTGVFVKRLTRFTAEVKVNGIITLSHIKNTGRLEELLVAGVKIYLNHTDKPTRSTKYDLVAVMKGKRLINIDSTAPNHAFGEFLKQGGLCGGASLIKSEVRYSNSRFDY